jgi:hypothetical protein
MTAMLIIGFWPLLVTNAQSLGRLARVAVAATAPAQA